MKIQIGSEIRIKDATKALQDWCSENLIVPNPEYTSRARRGLWLGNTPQYLWLYRVDGSDLVLPVGVGKQLRQFMAASDAVEIQLADNGILSYAGSVPLYDYQQPAVEAMMAVSCGILQSPCGSGKTQMGIALAARIARVADGKADAVCYDYVDAIQFCENQWKRRRTHYRKAGCEFAG